MIFRSWLFSLAACAHFDESGYDNVLSSAALVSQDLLDAPQMTDEEAAMRERLALVIETEGNKYMTLALARAIANAIVDEAVPAGLDPSLVLGIIATESGFNPQAISPAGARGLMQLMPDTRKWLLSRELDLNLSNEDRIIKDVRLGVRYFSLLKSVFRTNQRALSAYNCGPGTLIKFSKTGEKLPQETLQYPGRVFSFHRRYTVSLRPKPILVVQLESKSDKATAQQ